MESIHVGFMLGSREPMLRCFLGINSCKGKGSKQVEQGKKSKCAIGLINPQRTW